MVSAYDAIKAAIAPIFQLCGGESSEGEVSDGETSIKRLRNSSSSESVIGETLQEAAERIASEFNFPRHELRRAVNAFIQQLSRPVSG